MERVYIFDCDRIIGDEEKRTIIENMEGKAEVIFDNSEGYDRDTDIVISTRCVGNRDVAGMEVIIREDIGVGCDYVGTAPYVIYEPEEIDYYYCQKVYARKKGLPAFILETERFIVREESLDDLDELYELYDTLADCEFIEPLYELEKEKEFVRNYINNMYRFFEYGMWLVYSKDTGRLVGRMGIENRSIAGENVQEIGYLTGKPYQNMGIAYEVCSAIKEYAKEELGIDKLYSCIDKNNKPSISLIHKLGFKVYAQDIDGMVNIGDELERIGMKEEMNQAVYDFF